MRRLVLAAAGAATVLAAAACGSSSTGGGAASASSTSSTGTDGGPGGRGGPGRNAAAGEVVQLSGTRLVLNTTQSGDVRVSFATTTPVSKTSTGSLGDITDGECLIATGQKDSTGTFSATSVNISDPVGGSCTGAGIFGGPGAGNRSPNPSFSPNPSRSPRPAGQGGMAVRGQVTAENGVSITIMQLGGAASGQSTTITVPTTATVTRTASATASDIAVGDCVAAIGPKDSSGTVTAQTLAISPAGPNGCFTGRGAFGGFGGFRGGGGGAGGTGTTNG